MSSKTTEYGYISASFNSSPLKKLTDNNNGIQTGPFGSQLHQRDYVEFGTPIITVEHLGDNRILHENTPYVTDKDKLRLKKYSLKEGDIVFSRVGSVDRRALVRKEEEGWLFSGRCLRVRVNPDKIDPFYLSYFFGFEGFKNYIRSIAVGATMPSLNTKILSDIPIYYPKIEIQQKIGRYLNVIDEKINLNHQINQTLEEIAQTIFKAWFVDFDPVKAKKAAKANGQDPERAAMLAISGKTEEAFERLSEEQKKNLAETAALFPDEMQNSELGEIPKGWDIKKVEDIVTRLKPSKRYTSKQVEPYGTIPVFEQGNSILLGFHNDKPGFDASPEEPKFIFGDHTCNIHISTCPFDISQNVIPLTGNGFHTLWVFHAIKDKQVFQEYRRHWAEFIIHPIVIPSEELANLYANKIKDMFVLVDQLKSENSTLSLIRDTLLPKLLSGEIELNNIETNNE